MSTVPHRSFQMVDAAADAAKQVVSQLVTDQAHVIETDRVRRKIRELAHRVLRRTIRRGMGDREAMMIVGAALAGELAACDVLIREGLATGG